MRNNLLYCKLKPEVDNRHLSLNSILIDNNWRNRSKRFEQSMSKPTMVKLSTCRPKTISFWLWSRYDTKMVDGFVILFYCNQFFCASKKMLVEGDVVFILDRRRKAPERSWTWSSAILERGSGVWVGRVEVQLPPFPEKKNQQQQQQQHCTISSSTTTTTTTIKIKKTIKTLLCSSEEKFV